MRPTRRLPSSLALLAVIASPSFVLAQEAGPRPMPGPGGPAAGANPAARTAPGEIRGRLVTAVGAQPVTSGSITVQRAVGGTFAGGALPRPDGSFVVDGLLPGTYTVRIRVLGYAPILKPDVVIGAAAPRIDLGTLSMETVATTLERQTVVAEAAQQQLSPERNSYNVKSMATASGGTAVDALRNVPAVEVDGSNVVSLRGNSNVVVQINGRTSPLRGEQLGSFLAQLPAQSLSSVEVVTSPSAKDDPEGTAGIINLVLAQPVQSTVSGGMTAATGTTGLANVSGNIGKQTDQWTLFASGGGFHDARPMDGFADRTITSGASPSYSNSRVDGRMRPLSGNAMLRSEWKRNRTDALSFDAMANMGDFRRDITSRFATLDAARDTTFAWDQFADNGQHNLFQDFTLAYRRTAPPNATAPTFTTQLRFTQFQMHFQSLRANRLLGAGDEAALPPTERNGLRVRFPTWALQGDYARPFGPTTKLEGGFKSTLRTLNSAASASLFDEETEAFEPIAGRNYGLRYAEIIQAAYGTASRRVGKAQLQGGLRAEQTNTELELPALDGPAKRDYLSLFPSAFVNYNLTEMRQLRVGYSRRITRPDAPQLDPSPFYEDARTVFRGNPALRPEYTDAFEVTLQDARPWGNVQVNPYVRMSDDAVRNIRTVTAEGITLSTFANVATTRTAGADVNATIRRGPMNLGLGGGAFHYESEADTLSTTAFGWNARTNLSWKVSKALDFQAMANYRAAQRVEGGTLLPFVMTNFSLRHKLWGEQGSVTLRLGDPFNIARFATRVRNGVVIEESERRFGMRGAFLSFQRNFGQAIRLRPPPVDPNGAPQGGPPAGPPGGGN